MYLLQCLRTPFLLALSLIFFTGDVSAKNELGFREEFSDRSENSERSENSANQERLNPYAILGVPENASKRQIEAAYRALINTQGLSTEQKLRVGLCYSILINPILRKNYDEGKPIFVTLPDGKGQREKLAKLLDPTDPVSASRLRRTGKFMLDSASSAAIFYLAMGITSATQCVATSDPLYCKEYLHGLTEPSGQIGFGLFMVTSHLTAKGLSKFLGDSLLPGIAKGYGGMVAGSLANDIFNDVVHLPETEEMLESPSPELFSKIVGKTVGSAQWWTDKTPELGSLVAAATAAHFTSTAAKIGWVRAQRAVQRVKSGQKPCLKAVLEIFTSSGNLRADDAALEIIKRRWMKEKSKAFALELANILVFMGWSKAIHEPLKEEFDAGVNVVKQPEDE